jgi:formylglycine-generating enzyme required for sulfatase activity
MFGKAIVRGFLAVAVVCCAVVAQAVTIETVPICNSGNMADTTGYGAVGYVYQMGKYEVTAGQYTEFLNSKAKCDGDLYGLYNTKMADNTVGSYGCNIQRSGGGTVANPYTYNVAPDWKNRPVNYVSWYDCVRFANWLQNGQGSGSTETGGTYEITDGGYNSGTVAIPNAATRATWAAATAKHWVLPSEDEWYKAAYHKNNGVTGNYWIYPTGSDTEPTAVTGGTAAGTAVCWSNSISPTDTADANNAGGLSAYGTMGQGGNVLEWNETLVEGMSHGVLRGGYWNFDSASLGSSLRFSNDPTSFETNYVGFRVASVPEPCSLAMLLGIALTALLRWRRKRV